MLHKEAGGHRIQRIPPTERKGRVHTSTVTVAVVDSQNTTFKINDRDLKIEWYSGTGAGGQHRNKHQNSCRITHLPTQTVATAQCRSRANSEQEARSVLQARLEKEFLLQQTEITAHDRKNQVGSGERGDKIRTYRFQDDVVKDHRTNKTSSVSKILRGHFDLLWE